MMNDQQTQIDAAVMDNARPVFALSAYEVRRETQYPEYDYLLEFGGKTFLPRYELTAIYGKKKSGKSSFMRDVVRALCGASGAFAHRTSDDVLRILYVDTEQSEKCTQKIFDGTPTNAAITAVNLSTFYATDEQGQPVDRITAIMQAVTADNFDVVVIDTITEATRDYNDSELATATIGRFLAWLRSEKLTVIAVMHTNKNDNNCQGHWGGKVQAACFDGYLVSMGDGYTAQTIKHVDAREAPEHLLPVLSCTLVDGVRTYNRKDTETFPTTKTR